MSGGVSVPLNKILRFFDGGIKFVLNILAELWSQSYENDNASVVNFRTKQPKYIF
jgi:hypothetical protein